MILRIVLFLVVLATTLISSRTASADILTFSSKSAYDAKLVMLALNSSTTNFDSVSTGSKGGSFSVDGVQISTNGLLQVGNLGATTSGSNSVGYDDNFLPEFQAGDTVTFTLPFLSQGMGLSLITQTNQDAVSFGTLTSGVVSVNAQGVGTAVPGVGGFKSYFLGIINDSGPLAGATLSYTGGGSFRFDDLNIASVPEPSSLALATIVGMAGVFRRRRN